MDMDWFSFGVLGEGSELAVLCDDGEDPFDDKLGPDGFGRNELKLA